MIPSTLTDMIALQMSYRRGSGGRGTSRRSRRGGGGRATGKYITLMPYGTKMLTSRSGTTSGPSGTSPAVVQAAPTPSATTSGPSALTQAAPRNAAALSLQNLRVNRRQALPLRPVATSDPTPQGQRDRIEALRNQLRYAHALERALLVRHLAANAWMSTAQLKPFDERKSR
jgi:hypothetical protein